MPQALPDDVLSAAQSGDAEAFSQIYYTLAPGVSGYLKARGMEDAEGSAQEVFLTVFSRIGTVRGGYHGSWPGLVDGPDADLLVTTDYRSVLAEVGADSVPEDEDPLAGEGFGQAWIIFFQLMPKLVQPLLFLIG